jgi:hypothetical protein
MTPKEILWDQIPKSDGWLLIDTGYACGDVVIRNGKVIDAAPIFRKWAIGLTEAELRRKVKVIE